MLEFKKSIGLFTKHALLASCAGALVAASYVPNASAAGRPQRIIISAGVGGQTGAHGGGASYFAPMQAAMTENYPIVGVNADGSDLWPCAGRTSPANGDCPTVGNPALDLPDNGLVTGFPGFGWTLANDPNRGNGTGCDALTDGTGPQGIPYKPCAQIVTYYDDNTNDSTDDLLWRVKATQNGVIIYDSGTLDFGPAGPTVNYPVHVLLANDVNYGYWPGASQGPNNGNCSGDLNYPLKAPTFPTGSFYEVESGKTCGEPTAGPIKVMTETILATPSYRKVSGNACTSHGVPSPCYLTSWAKTTEIHQNFPALLQ
jgi:hypothetical protein